MNLKVIMLSEMSEHERYQIISLICGIQITKTHTGRYYKTHITKKPKTQSLDFCGKNILIRRENRGRK